MRFQHRTILFLLFMYIVAGALVLGKNSITVAAEPPTQNEILEQIGKPVTKIRIPGLSFSEPQVSEKGGITYLSIPFIGDYIKAAYVYGIIAAAIVAVVFIVQAAIGLVISKGEAEAVTHHKKKIANGIAGVILAVGSYTLLYFINPQLVQFRNLQIQVIDKKELGIPEEHDELEPGEHMKGTATPTWNNKTFDCAKKSSYAPAGVAPLSNVIRYTCKGIDGTITSVPEMRAPLCAAGQKAEKAGYRIKIHSSYRPFEKQVDLWCGQGATKYPDVTERKKFFATPGFSQHGSGRAVDVSLYKDGEQLTVLDSKKQCGEDEKEIALLASFFYEADTQFNRLETEIWHFEFGTSGTSSRGKYKGRPTACK